MSVDSSESHADFARDNRLPFVLLSDRRGVVAARYGSLLNLGLMRFAKRNTFLIDPDGNVAKVYLGVNPTRHAGDVLADLTKLRGS